MSKILLVVDKTESVMVIHVASLRSLINFQHQTDDSGQWVVVLTFYIHHKFINIIYKHNLYNVSIIDNLSNN